MPHLLDAAVLHQTQVVGTHHSSIPLLARAGPQRASRPWHSLAPASAVQEGSDRSSGEEQQPITPWPFGFQCNERYLAWSDGAQIRLLKLHVCHTLGQRMTWVETRLAQLMGLLPDLMDRIEHMKADMLVSLVEKSEEIAVKAVKLKQLMPDSDVSALVAAWPGLVLTADLDDVERRYHELSDALGERWDVQQTVAREPLLLQASLPNLLAELKRLMPGLQDPLAFLVSSPRVVLDMQSAGMPSTIDGDLVGGNAQN